MADDSLGTELSDLDPLYPAGASTPMERVDNQLQMLKIVMLNSFGPSGKIISIRGTATATGDEFVLSTTRSFSAYVKGMLVQVTIPAASAGSPTLAIDSMAAKNILTVNGTVPTAVEMPAGTHLLMYDGTNFVLLSKASHGSLFNVQIFTSPGTATWTKPDGTKAIEVWCIGGGGGGGGATSTVGGFPEIAAGAGGAAGGGAYSFITSGIPSSATVTVGSGGSAGSLSGGSGGLGSKSSFESLVSANGGSGGGGATSTATNIYGTNTAPTGSSGTIGDILIKGGAGRQGVLSSLVNSTPALVGIFGASGDGGNSPFGFGLGGRSRRKEITSAVATQLTGENGTGYGSGGSGGLNMATTGGAAGGAGASGLVIVKAYT